MDSKEILSCHSISFIVHAWIFPLKRILSSTIFLRQLILGVDQPSFEFNILLNWNLSNFFRTST